MAQVSREQSYRLHLRHGLIPSWWALIPIELIAFLVRFVGLGNYHGLIYDEYYYVTAADVLLHLHPPVLVKHLVYGIDPNLLSAPPFAKEVIAGAIACFGNSPWIWRLPGAFLGAVVPLIIYLLAQRMFGSRRVAWIAAALSAVDGLMVSTSRLALLDSIAFPFVIWNLTVLWQIWRDLSLNRDIKRTTLWVFGITLGLGFSAKWIGAQTILMAWIILSLSWRQILSNSQKWLYLASVTVIPLAIYFLTYAYAFPSGFHQSYLPQNVFLAWGKLQWLILKNMWAFKFVHPWTANAWTWLALPRPTAYLWITQSHVTIRMLAFSDPLVIWIGLLSFLVMLGLDIHKRRLRPTTLFFIVWFLVFYGTWLTTPRTKFNYYFLSMMPMLIICTAYSLATLAGYAKKGFRWLARGEALMIALSTVYLFPLWVGMPMPHGFYHSVFWSPTWNARVKPSKKHSVQSPARMVALKGENAMAARRSLPTSWTGFETGLNRNTVFDWNKRTLKTGYIMRLGPAPVVDQPAVAGNDAYVGTNGNRLVAWNLHTGQRLWNDSMPNMIMATPLVWHGEVIVALGNKAFRGYSKVNGWIRGTGTSGIMAVNAKTGHELWFTPTVGEDMPTPALQNGVIYEVSGSGQFLAISATRGKILWSLALSGFDSMSSVTVDGPNAFVATNLYKKAYPASSSTVWDVNIQSHTVAWHKDLPVASGLSDNTPAISGHLLYIAGVPRIVDLKTGQTWLNNELFAINIKNGHIVWKQNTGGGISPIDKEEEGIPFATSHKVFIANPANRNLSAFNEKSGKLIWRVPLPAAATANPIVVGSSLWLGLHNGMIMQIQVRTGHIIYATQEYLGGFGPAAFVSFPHALLVESMSGNVAMIPVR